MANRRGLGTGKGKGYYNIINKDSSIHSMSAKGMKQPQRLNIHPTKEELARHKWEHYLMHMDNFKDTDGDKAPDIIDCDPLDPDEQGVKDVWDKFRNTLASYHKTYKQSEEYANLPDEEKKKIDKLEKDISNIDNQYTLQHFINKHSDTVLGMGFVLFASNAFPVVGQAVAGAVEGVAIQKDVYKDLTEWDDAKAKWMKKLRKKLPDVSEKELNRLAGKEALKDVYGGFDEPEYRIKEYKQPVEATEPILDGS